MNRTIQTNLILVDGLPGSGKSTTAQQLYMHLIKHGYKAHWFFEHDVTHPIYVNTEVRLAREVGDLEPNKIHEKALTNWANLVSSTGAENIAILEGTLFQSGAGSQFVMNWEPDKIASYAFLVEKLIERLDPVLIYFYQTDVAEALRRICKCRGRWFEEYLVKHVGASPYGKARGVTDIASVIEVLKAFREITDFIFAKLRMRKLAVETSDGKWRTYCEQISHFLSIPPMERPVLCASRLERLTGKYRQPNSGDEFVIRADENGLFFDDKSQTRLIQITNSVFFVQAMNIELTFEEDTKGVTGKIELSGDLPNLPNMWRKL
jgi:thymidylate kinase